MEDKQKVIKHVPWKKLIPTASKSAIDLISKLFTWNPDDRISAKEVLEHPFLEELYDPEDQDIIESKPIQFQEFEFECYSLNKDILRELILDEVIMFNSKEGRKTYRKLQCKYPDGLLERIYTRQTENNKPSKENHSSQNVGAEVAEEEKACTGGQDVCETRCSQGIDCQAKI